MTSTLAGSVEEMDCRQAAVMLGVELGLIRRMCAWRRDWPRTAVVKPVWPEEEAATVEAFEELDGRDFVLAGAVTGKAPGRGPTFAGNGEGEGGYFEEVLGGEMRCAALLWLLEGREAFVVGAPCALNGFGIGSAGVFTSGGL